MVLDEGATERYDHRKGVLCRIKLRFCSSYIYDNAEVVGDDALMSTTLKE